MPRQAKQPYFNPLPSELQTFPTSRDSKSQLSHNEWTTKNARAKALILSTIVPGSEAWKIAQSFEYASDIWKALEEKYGPKHEINSKALQQDNSSASWLEVPAVKTRHDPAAFAEPRREANMVEGGSRRGESASEVESLTHPNGGASPTQAEIDEGRRDRRFLWALLNGGRETLDAVTI